MKKFLHTLKIATTLVMARTFGTYRISVYADGVSYAKYEWRGKLWAFPTKPIEEEEEPRPRINIVPVTPEMLADIKRDEMEGLMYGWSNDRGFSFERKNGK